MYKNTKAVLLSVVVDGRMWIGETALRSFLLFLSALKKKLKRRIDNLFLLFKYNKF